MKLFLVVLMAAFLTACAAPTAVPTAAHHGGRYDAKVGYIKLDFDKFELSDSIKMLLAAKLALDEFMIDQKAKHGTDYSVIVIGHTDYVGSDEYNVGLGMRRAQAVAKYLESNGVSIKAVLSSGETDDMVTEPYIAQNVHGIGTRETNRSVTLVILH